MNDAEKAYQYFVIAVPENEEQAKAYFWARKALQPTLTPPNEWVSAEDDPPKLTGKYICCVEDIHGRMWSISADYLFEMKTWVGEFGEIKIMCTYTGGVCYEMEPCDEGGARGKS